MSTYKAPLDDLRFALYDVLDAEAQFARLGFADANRELVDAVRTTRLFGHLRRSIAGSMAMFFGFTALSLLPLPDATAIGYATPLMTTALAALVLKEVVRVYRWSALGVGFCGPTE